MCQLLGMNCATPTDFTFSFKGFRERGGRTDVHADGWGLAFYPSNHGNGSNEQGQQQQEQQQQQQQQQQQEQQQQQQQQQVRCFKETRAAARSSLAMLLSHVPIRTRNMMSHLRLATRGEVEPANVHPFQRELWGVTWSFCHNGDVPMAADHMPRLGRLMNQKKSHNMYQPDDCSDDGDDDDDDLYRYRPLGQTDSERVFCAILNALSAKFSSQPSLSVLFRTLQDLCQEIVQYHPTHTILNFLLTCGPDVMFAYSWPGKRPGGRTWNGLHYIVRQPPFATATLRDVDDCTVDFSLYTTTQDRVSVVATKPLTYEQEWVEFERGQLILFQNGVPQQMGGGMSSSSRRDDRNFVPPRLEEGNAVVASSAAAIALSA